MSGAWVDLEYLGITAGDDTLMPDPHASWAVEVDKVSGVAFTRATLSCGVSEIEADEVEHALTAAPNGGQR